MIKNVGITKYLENLYVEDVGGNVHYLNLVKYKDFLYFKEDDLERILTNFPEFDSVDVFLLSLIEHNSFRLINITHGYFNTNCLRFEDYINKKRFSRTEEIILREYIINKKTFKEISRMIHLSEPRVHLIYEKFTY